MNPARSARHTVETGLAREAFQGHALGAHGLSGSRSFWTLLPDAKAPVRVVYVEALPGLVLVHGDADLMAFDTRGHGARPLDLFTEPALTERLVQRALRALTSPALIYEDDAMVFYADLREHFAKNPTALANIDALEEEYGALHLDEARAKLVEMEVDDPGRFGRVWSPRLYTAYAAVHRATELNREIPL